MARGRFLYNNLITAAAMITPSSQRAGRVSPAIKEGSGAATMQTSGEFSGPQDLEYTVEIDSVGAGVEVGQATFKWSDGTSVWNATGVTTSTAWITLNNAVKVKWTVGSGNDFAVGDKWYFKATLSFGKHKLLDLDRNTMFRSSGLDNPTTLTIDFGSVREISSLIVFDHNISSAVTELKLKANTVDSGWGAAPSLDLTYNADKLVHYLSPTASYRYFQLHIKDQTNPDGYIQIGNLFLGSYLEPTSDYRWDWIDNNAIVQEQSELPSGVRRRWAYNLQKTVQVSYKLDDTGYTSFKTMLDAIFNKADRSIDPVFWNRNSASPNDTWLMDFPGLSRQVPYTNLQDVSLELKEVVKDV